MLLNRAHVLLKDDRKDLRITDRRKLTWQIKYKQKEGHARIYDISASGMRMETDVVFDPTEECILSFDSCLDADNYIPKLGRLVWSRKKRFFPGKYFCGIKFLEADPDVLERMRQRVSEGVARYLKRRKFVTILGSFLFVGCVALIGFLIWTSGGIYQNVTTANTKWSGVSRQQTALVRRYAQGQKAAEVALAAQTERLNIANQLVQEERAALALYAKELEATKALLSETETMLNQANTRNAALVVQNRTLSQEIELMQSRIQTRLSKKQSIEAIATVKGSMEDYRRQLQSIKLAMRQLKADERAVRISAILEMDKQRALLGNNGYFVKGGKPIQVDNARYQRINAGTYFNPKAPQPANDVEIDIKFFE